MIPKVIHYCWFGGNPIPEEYLRYMESWKRFFPDYEIRRWDESSFDVDAVPFTKEAYGVGKFAYVSDYARLKILYERGGVYFDTDVEVIRSLDDIIAKGAFMGFEKNTNARPGEMLSVNVGLGFAVEAGNPIIREVLDFYESHHYIYPDGHMEQIPIVPIVTKVLKEHGLNRTDVPTVVDGITVYPWDYFCPIEFMGRKLEITPNTRTIHHYSATWMSRRDKWLMRRGYWAAKIKRFLKSKYQI